MTYLKAPRVGALIIALAFAAGCADDTQAAGPESEPDQSPTSQPDPQPEPDAQPEAEPDPVEPQEVAETVETSEGPIEGVFDQNLEVVSWRGVPFAADPSGELRWRPPQPPPLRSETLDASTSGRICFQPTTGDFGPLLEGEDCLNLNIWTPEGTEPGTLPVLFWIHGGSFTSGSGSFGIYDGSRLAQEGVVVVGINYRLGPLGFLAHEGLIGEEGYPATGNYGLLDQIAALEWVRENIAGFGGDPQRVTIFGESAGAISVCGLMTSPLAEGLFDKALMQSGFCSFNIAHMTEASGNAEPAVATGQEVSGSLGCSAQEDELGCMRAAPIADIRAATAGKDWGPVVDDHVLPLAPAVALFQNRVHDVPLLIGANADEGTIFIDRNSFQTAEQYEQGVVFSFGQDVGQRILEQYPLSDFSSPFRAISAVFGDFVFVCPTRYAAGQHNANGRASWLYHFTHETAYGRRQDLGAFHSSELTFVFGTMSQFFFPTPQEVTLSLQFISLWTSFATDGVPTAEGLQWDTHDPAQGNSLELNAEAPAMINNFRGEYCDFWADAFN